MSNTPGIGSGPGLVQPAAPTAAPGEPPAQDPVATQLQALNAQQPGRYKAVPVDQVPQVQKEIEGQKPGQFVSGLKGSLVGQNATLAGNFLEAISQVTSSAAIYSRAKEVQAWGKDKSDGYEPKVGSIADIRHDTLGHLLSDAGDYTAYSAGSMLGSSAPSLVTGIITSLVTDNPVLGIAAGAAAPSLIQNGGDLYGMVRDSAGVADAVKAGRLTPKDVAKWSLIGAVPLAALDVVGLEATLGAVAFKGLKKTIMGRIAQGIATGTIAEGSTEGLQQVVEESVAAALGDKSPMSQRVINVLDNAIGGAIGGGMMGGPGHALSGARQATSDAVKLHRAAVAADAAGGAPAPTRDQPRQDPAAQAQPAGGAPAVAESENPAPPIERGAGADIAPVAPAAAPLPTERPTGPISRAAEIGRATEHAKTAEAIAPIGSRVTISIPGVPAMDVTVHGYDPAGMHVQDDQGEVHTLPMDDPDVQVTPIAAAPAADMEPQAQQPELSAEPVASVAPPAVDMPLARKVGDVSVMMPDDAHADLFDLGRKREMARKGSTTSMARADKLLADDRRRAAVAMGIDIGAVNAAADEYRAQVEQAAKQGGEVIAPEFERAPGNHIEQAAHEAATSPTNDLSEPTQAQKEAGNYKLGHVKIGGLDLSIENPAGSERKGVDAGGKPWSVKMRSHYGYIKGTVGRDKDHVDAFVKLETPANLPDDAPIYIVDQRNQDMQASFDEHKVMIGFGSKAEAKKAYLANYAKGWDGAGAITEMTLARFKDWLKNGDTTKPASFTQPIADLEKTGDVAHEDMRLTSNERAAANYALDKGLVPADGPVATSLRASLDSGATADEPARQHLETALDLHHSATSGEKPAAKTVKWRGDKVPRAQIEGSVGAFKAAIADTEQTIAKLEKEKKKGNTGRLGNLRKKLVDRQKLLNEAETALGQEPTKFTQSALNTLDELHPSAGALRKAEPVAVSPSVKWFGTREKAEAYITKKKLGATHEVVPNGLRFEVREQNTVRVEDTDRIRMLSPSEAKAAGLSDEVEKETAAKPTDGMTQEESQRFAVERVEAGLPPWKVRLELAEKGLNGSAAIDLAMAPAMKRRSEIVQAAKVKTPQTAPPLPAAAYGASNKLVTAARADEIRAKLRDKLKNQVNSGIDPEILALGTELAAFHIEAGARKFGDFAKAVAADMGSTVGDLRKYLRSWYNGARDLLEDSGHDVAGMDSPDEVRVELKRLAETEKAGGSPELEGAGQSALEGVSADSVRGTEQGGDAGQGAGKRSRSNIDGNERIDGAGLQSAGSLGDRQGTLSLSPAGGDETGKRQPKLDAKRSPDARGRDAGGADERRSNDGNPNRGPQERLEANKPSPESAATPAAEIAGNYTITEADALGDGGQRTKLRQNLDAIRLLNKIEAEGRRATRSEQAVLAKYVGWGGLKAVFPREDGSVTNGWEKASAELRALLSDEEYKAAAASTRNAHYTRPEIVKAMWSAVRRLGFAGGKMLEPSVGTGNFLGMMPADARKAAQITGVELDRITGGIVKQLYPDANIQAPIGFQALSAPDDYFDLAIGNPPFGSERLYDPNRKHLSFSIHNFFFAKSLDTLKPGGVLAMVVSDSLMDTQGDKARAYLSDRADLLGAIRLPNDAFTKNAGTDVTTDIIFLRKRAEGEAPAGPAWLNARMFKDENGKEMLLNEYFHANPNQMLGKFGAYGTMYREGDAALIKNEGQDTAKLLNEAIRRLPEGVMAAAGVEVEMSEIKAPHNAADAIVGSGFLDDKGQIWVRDPDHLGEARAKPMELPNERAIERVSGMLRIRDAFALLRKAQLDESAEDKKLKHLRDRMNKVYDSFVSKHGPINLDANKRLFEDDPTWPQISALEDKFDKGLSATVAKKTGEAVRAPSAQKAAVFSKRTQFPYVKPTSAASAKDALAISQGELGRVDMEYMMGLYGKPEAAIVDELGDLVFKDPEGGYEPRDAYLAGNVKRKLAIAAEIAKTDPQYRRNVEALREVIPADINAADIEVTPGAHWIPPQYVGDFIDHITEGKGARAFYSDANARWIINGDKAGAAVQTRWGTDRASVKSIIDAALHGSTITIRDPQRDGSSILNQAATDAANEKVNRVSEEWSRWLWQDDARREAIASLYNDTFNTDVLRVYDGSHLTLPGKVGDDIIRFRPHQLNFVWRMIQTPTSLADHVVGAGKTFEIIAGIMEKRRMGIAKKPMLVVPNHLVGQWAADFNRLYPGARVLAATKKDFEAANRKRLFARVATGDWDAVIVAHSSFGKIPVDLEFHKQFISDQMADLETSIAAVREADGKKSRNVAQLEKARENLKSKLERLLDAGSKDVGLTFQDIGVDDLSVDEAHEFKNLGFSTSMQRVAGIGNQAGSQKAADLYMKSQIVLQKTGGRNVTFATGTPISNTMAEMYTMQRYLSARTLKDLGLAHFDAWARMFGKVVTDWELSPSGQYKLKSRFAKFVNMPELLRQYRTFADVITRDDIKRQLAEQGRTLGVPNMVGGKPQIVIAERSKDQAAYMGLPVKDKDGNDTDQYPKGSLIWRAENLPKKAEKGGDNMLKIMSDARKSALDMRMIDPSYPDNPGSKINDAADNMVRIYKEWDHKKGVQLVFIDLSTPKGAKVKEVAALRELVKAADDGDEAAQTKLDAMSPDEFDALDGDFSVYDDLKQKLIDRSVLAHHIAFIHDANTEKQKDELFGKVRSGIIRFLLGSTAKMGAGTNVQNRLVALHHIDAPWRPSDLEQREGRIIRQGNELYDADPEGFEVGVYRYATKNTLDARMWQTIEAKARFIEQVRKGDLNARQIEDIAGEAANAAEMKAAASGNPLILEEMDLRQKVRKLDQQRSNHDREQYDIKRRISSDHKELVRLNEVFPKLQADAERASAIGRGFVMEIGGKTFEKHKEAGAAILVKAAKMMATGAESVELGEFGGFPLRLDAIDGRHGSGFAVQIESASPEQVYIEDAKAADPTGLAVKISNAVKSFESRASNNREWVKGIERDIPALEAQIKPWDQDAQLDAAKERHREVITALQPKKKEAAPVAKEGDITESVPDRSKPVAKIKGDEIGANFKIPGDMPAMRKAAQDWYDAHLRGETVHTADGLAVRFNQRGRNKSVHGKGDVLLRAVPAIRQIIEKGSVVLREPGTKPGVSERIVIAAPIELDGKIKHLAVSIHRLTEGHYQYDFNIDKNAGDPGIGARLAGGKAADSKESIASKDSVTENGSGINLSEWRGLTGETPADAGMTAAEVRDVLDGTPWSGAISALIDAGQIKIEDTAPAGSQAEAYVTNADGVVHLVASNLAPEAVSAALLHEVFHSGVRPLVGDAAWTKLQGRLKSLYNQAKGSKGGARTVYDAALARMAHAEQVAGAYSEELTPEEFGAYIISEHETMPRAFGDWAREAIGALKAWLLRRFGLQAGKVTPEQLRALAIAAVREGKVGTAGRGPTRTPQPVAESRGSPAQTGAAVGRAESVAQPSAAKDNGRFTSPKSLSELSDMVKGLAEDVRGPAMSLLPLNTLADWAGKGQVAVGQYIGLKRTMDAFRNRKQVDADKVVNKWRKVIGKNGKSAKALADIMHDSTLAGVDPSNTDMETAAKTEYADLRKRFMALSPAARAMYGEVRDDYVAQAKELDQILLEKIQKAMDQQVTDAERRHEAELEDIRDLGLTGQAKDDAIAKADRRLAVAKQKLQFGTKARMAALRKSFEATRVPDPYFPLARFGDYFVTVKNDDGKVISFSRRETAAARNVLEREMRKAYPGMEIDTGVLSNANNVKEGMDPRLMAEVSDILGGAGVDDEVMDAIWQRYLSTMPDLSIRKRFIHRQGVAGFHEDALRSYASHMFHAAHQMARVKFGGDLQELVNQARDQVKTAAPSEKILAGKIANELELRHQWVMNPENASWATKATSLGFVYFLGMSPASAVVNLSQTAIMGVPIIGSRFGMGKAISGLMAASRDFIAGKGSVEGANLSADERAAMKHFDDIGLIDKSMAHDLSGVADRGADYNPTRVRVMKSVSFLFHHAERFNREVTALAAFRLARKSGMGMAESLDKAAELTWKTHFDYSNTNRPRLMYSDAAKVALLFKNFQINMIYRLFRDTQQSFAGETAAARKEARYQLAGIMGMYALMAGAMGVPLMQQVIIPLFGLIFGDPDDGKSWKEEFRDSVVHTLGPQLGGMALDGVPGYLTGTSLTQRMGMADLWFQSDDRVQTSQDWWNNMSNDLLGPVWGMAHNAYNGLNVIRDGKGVARGIEMMAPTAIKNLMKAWRYQQEGAVNLRGDTVVPQDSIGVTNAAKQAIGFTPAVVTEQYTRNDEKTNMEKRIANTRKALLDAFHRALASGDQSAQDKVMAEIVKFNAVPINQARAITGATIRASEKTRQRLSNKAENGVVIQNKKLNYMLNQKMPDRVY
ncbi:MAG: PLxRFG domain-containing protein [Rhodopseudomonas sp.]|nr:PLxRFG domain-containing protein [Rhodopseudomonas sp.]